MTKQRSAKSFCFPGLSPCILPFGFLALWLALWHTLCSSMHLLATIVCATIPPIRRSVLHPPPLPYLLALCGSESRERRRTARASRSGRTERRERFLESWRSGYPAGRRDGAHPQSESARMLAGESAPRQDSPCRSESLLGGEGAALCWRVPCCCGE